MNSQYLFCQVINRKELKLEVLIHNDSTCLFMTKLLRFYEELERNFENFCGEKILLRKLRNN